MSDDVAAAGHCAPRGAPEPCPALPGAAPGPGEVAEGAASPQTPLAAQAPAEEKLPMMRFSTTRNYRFKPFEMTLVLSRSYVESHRVTREDVIRACESARCCSYDGALQDIGSCAVCSRGSKKKPPVVTVASGSTLSVGPFETTAGPAGERALAYVFNRCRSRCSSSRDHLRSRVLLVVDALPGLVVVGPPLALLSRPRTCRSSPDVRGELPAASTSPPALPAGAAVVDKSPVLPAESAGLPRSSLDVRGDVFEAAGVPRSGLDVRGDLFESAGLPRSRSDVRADLTASPVSSRAVRVSALVPRSSAVDPADPAVSAVVLASPARLRGPERPLGVALTHVVVAISSTNLTELGAAVLQEQFQAMLGCVPGFGGHVFQWRPGTLIGIGRWNNQASACQAVAVVDRYTRGENPWRQDLIEAGALNLISLCKSF
eukprot:m51a1_g4712 hypothetical protein (431) ;mRNA; f:293519-295208